MRNSFFLLISPILIKARRAYSKFVSKVNLLDSNYSADKKLTTWLLERYRDVTCFKLWNQPTSSEHFRLAAFSRSNSYLQNAWHSAQKEKVVLFGQDAQKDPHKEKSTKQEYAQNGKFYCNQFF